MQGARVDLAHLAQRHEGHYVLKVAGKIDLATVDQFEDALRQAIAALEKVVVIDLSGVEYIDSTGITALLQAETSSRGDVDRIQFLNKFQPDVEALLRVSCVYDELQLIEPETLPQHGE